MANNDHLAFGNFTDHFQCNNISGRRKIAHCVHPVIGLGVYNLLVHGTDVAKAAMEKIVNEPWYPGVLMSHIELGMPQTRDKIFEMSSIMREMVVRYNLAGRFQDVNAFPLHYLEERFNARTPTFTSFRGFYQHLKFTDAAWLHPDED